MGTVQAGAAPVVSSLACASSCGSSARWGEGRGEAKRVRWLHSQATWLPMGSQHSVSVLNES